MLELILSKAEDVRPLRQAVLRPDAPVDACAYPQDEDERTLHLTLKDGARVVGAVSLLHEPRAGLGSEVWRVRGLAVDPGFRGQGVGRRLVLTVQAVGEKRGGGLWASVCEDVVPFYGKLGFRTAGPADGEATGGDGRRVIVTGRPRP